MTVEYTVDYNAKLDNGGYIAKLSQDYEVILEQVRKGALPMKERITAIETATNDYLAAQDADYERKKAKGGHIPIQLRNDVLLHRLADLILYEDLTWSHPDKMSIIEYPVMSGNQQERRERNQPPSKDVSYGDRRGLGRKRTFFTDDNETPQGRNHRVPDVRESEILATDSHIVLYNALDNAGLTDRQRQAIDLVYFEDMTQAQAGDVMGVNRHTVNEHLSTSYLKLRKVLRNNTEQTVD